MLPIEIVYDSINATTWREMIALKATGEPILIKERRRVRTHDNVTAFAGICFLGSTAAIHFEKGKPLSLAKA